jgi:hypothetical protein
VRIAFRCAAVLCLASFAVTGFSQSAAPAATGKPAQVAGSQPDSKLAQLDQGAISGNTYSNKILGFSTEFPSGWKIVDAAEQRKTIESNHAATYGDSEAAEREHEMVWRCTRILLWTKKLETDVLLVTAVDPGCFPEIRLPASSDDRDGIQRVVKKLRRPPLGQGEHILSPDETVTTFVLQGHLMLDISAPDTTGDSPVYMSYVITPVKDYWLTLMFAAPSQAALQELKKKSCSSVKFEVP